MKLAFGSDHAGFHYKRHLANLARSLGHEVEEFGAASEESYDYPDAADAVACEIVQGRCDLGVLICGSGIGISIRANRYTSIRAAVCWDERSAELAREHNHANILCLGERLVEQEEAEAALKAFLKQESDESERHVRRVRKLGEPPKRC